MRWLIAIGSVLAAGGQALAAEPAAPVEVMVLGTYHMDNPGLDLANLKADDVLKPGRQAELDALSGALAEFKPTKIIVERVAKTSALADDRYAAFTPADLTTNRDERYQIAYRLAHRLGHKIVYAIDETGDEGEPDYFPFGKVVEWAKANGREEQLNAALENAKSHVQRIEKLQAEGSIAYVLADINEPERSKQDQQWYYQLNSYGDTQLQPGPELNAYWYMRNAKIFGKLVTIVRPGDRLLVIYGSGHNYWLRHLAELTPGFHNVDPTPYLRKAGSASK